MCRNETHRLLFKGGLLVLGTVMQPIERVFVLMAIIGVVGFVATVVLAAHRHEQDPT